jgi:uncharacterized zinc-type alcohol dehydrogenase-like protein
MIPVKGYAALAVKKDLAPYNFERREVGDNDILIDIQYCGICHSDIHQVRDEWGGSKFPMVPGHEIVGIVSKIGSKVINFQVGERVGVGCMVDSCKSCDNCIEDLEQFCLEGMTATYNSQERDRSGITQGGYSTKIVVNQDFVLHLPKNLSMEGMAPLLCAGITLYSPLKHWQAGPGGLGHMGVKIAHALGAHVTVLSQSLKKLEDSKRLGADNFYATSDDSTFKKLANTFDLIICTVSANLDWNKYLGLLKRDGTMVLLGIPGANIPVGAFSLIGGRRSLAGSLIGGIKETQEMLDFCGKHNIVADIEKVSIQEVNQAYERVLNSDVHYRFVIDIASLNS